MKEPFAKIHTVTTVEQVFIDDKPFDKWLETMSEEDAVREVNTLVLFARTLNTIIYQVKEEKAQPIDLFRVASHGVSACVLAQMIYEAEKGGGENAVRH